MAAPIWWLSPCFQAVQPTCFWLILLVKIFSAGIWLNGPELFLTNFRIFVTVTAFCRCDWPLCLFVYLSVPNCLRDGDGLYVDPSDCAWYIQCAAGRAHRKPCPSGTYFSHQTGACGFYKDLCRGDYGPAAEHSAREGGDGGFVEIQLVGPELPHTDFYVVENQPRQIAPPARKPAPDPNHLLVGECFKNCACAKLIFRKDARIS